MESATVEVPQHMQALSRANKVRLARAAAKREIGREELSVEQVVREIPFEMESITLSELLCAQRRWGRTRARKFLYGLHLNENKRLGTLTARQRSLIVAALNSGPGTGL